MTRSVPARYDAVLFDLLTALLDSWSLWNAVAGDAETGSRWRGEYLRLTYGVGGYRSYEGLVADAARAQGLDPGLADQLFVAGSRFDIPGAGGVGMPVWWYDRIGMDRGGLPAPLAEHRSLTPLPADVLHRP